MPTTTNPPPRLPIAPCLLTPDEYQAYSGTWETEGTWGWKQLIESGNDDALKAAFQSGKIGQFINYVYLDATVLEPLLDASNPSYANTDCIKTMFVLVPDKEVPTQYTFSVAVCRANEKGDCYPGYYLAGVAASPCPPPPSTTEQGVIPNEEAYAMMRAWDKAEHDGASLLPFFSFPSSTNAEAEVTDLMGRIFELSDFTAPWSKRTELDTTVWLLFGIVADKTIARPLFDLILQLDKPPTLADTILLLSEAYYDVSKPCPPFYSYKDRQPLVQPQLS